MANGTPLKFPAGLDNRSRESSLPEGALRVCVNLDVTREGGLLARQGLRELIASGAHSFYGHPYQSYALCVVDGELNRFDGTTLNPLRTVRITAPMSYAILNGSVFFSNGYEQGRVDSSGNLAYWGIPTPPPPTCVPVTAGGCRAGTMRVTQTAVSPDGLESGAPEPVAVTVAEGGGVQVTVPTGADFRVYATDIDDSIYREVAQVASGGTITVGRSITGKPLESLFAVKPIPGQIVTTHKGRLWVASGHILWFTDELSPHWLFPHYGFFQFDSDITLVGAAEDGLFIGTPSRIYYLQGSLPTEMTLRQVLHLGAVPGGLNDAPQDVLLGQGSFPSRCCVFMDTEGAFCIGRPGGIVQRVTDDRYVIGNAARAEISYWQHDGLRQFAVLATDQIGRVNSALDALVQTTFANGTSL